MFWVKKSSKTKSGILFYQLGLVLDRSRGVSVGVQEHLRVGVDGDEGLEVTVGLHKVHDGLDLGLGVSLFSPVGL